MTKEIKLNNDILEILRKDLQKHNAEQLVFLDNLLFLHIGGSRLYGINKPDSDYDVRGVFLAPMDYWVGMKTVEQVTFKTEDKNYDFVLYDFRKWLRLTINCNPNVIETLFVDNDNPNVIYNSEIWRDFIKPEVLKFVNQSAYSGYNGYAYSQIQKMVIKNGNKTGRQEIVEEFGFDVKFASHGFRLIRQGIELLNTGKITFPRPDFQDLLDIRNGKKYGKSDMNKCSDDWQNESKGLDIALKNSPLPKMYDFDKVNKFLMDIFNNFVYKEYK